MTGRSSRAGAPAFLQEVAGAAGLRKTKEKDLIIKSVNLEIVVGITSKLPQTRLPQFAFAGKSNVGKSTLINGLMNRKSYARTSAKPGKTQTINYYNINDEMYLVDLPGYGYATAGVEVKAKWGKMIENYLYHSEGLRTVFLLVDIRHEPTADDRQMFSWIVAAGYPVYVIATKADKIKRSQLQKSLKVIRDSLEECLGEKEATFTIIPYAGLTKDGREDIYEVIEELMP